MEFLKRNIYLSIFVIKGYHFFSVLSLLLAGDVGFDIAGLLLFELKLNNNLTMPTRQQNRYKVNVERM